MGVGSRRRAGCAGDQPADPRGRVPPADGFGGGHVNDVALTSRQVRYTNRAFWRNPQAAFFTFAFPLMFLVIFAVLLVAICASFGAAFYNASIPTGIGLVRTIVVVLVGAASFAALGLALTGGIPNADAAPPVVNATILPLLFISGVS